MHGILVFVFAQNTKRNSITITFYLGLQFSSQINKRSIIQKNRQRDIKLAHVFRFFKFDIAANFLDLYLDGWNRFSLFL